MTDTRLALSEVRGPLNDLNEKLGGVDGATVWLPAFKRFLRKENPWEQVPLVTPTIVPAPAILVGTYRVGFVPGLTWEQRIDRCHFQYHDDIFCYLRSLFPPIDEESTTPVSVKVYCLGVYATKRDVELFQTENGLEMISPARFLHLCEGRSELCRNRTIVCTKKIGDPGDQRGVCCLTADWVSSVFALRLSSVSRSWYKETYFPFISKDP